ncbi:nucleotidyltransferase domain-containing protein (plasmid) [Streptomyces scopuliridis]|uniref:nucleotidyltransferase domain-containing protein n=1 Tax=Streptomyces scopuliridis TaxID=452529 RepID=UPI002DD87188|nr:nucleotidyltransferase domain-containing protein [Streptomyces scopuliridis]WSB39063.1 nucleotidyltransferase domain-containing protein [Streptomyces scopuliridis]
MGNMTEEDWLALLRERHLIPEGTQAAFVVGSVARGWHNPRSDYDIYVVSNPLYAAETSEAIPVPLEPSFVSVEVFYAREKRWEVKYWSDAQIDQMLAKVSWEAYERGTIAGNVLAPIEELTLARFGHCLPLIGADWVEERRGRLAGTAFRSFVIARSLGEVDTYVEDALGQMEAGDLESAVLSARQAFGHAVDALLEGKGEFGSHQPKWRANRFKAATPGVLTFDEYWAVETLQTYDSADPLPWIKNVLALCQDIAMRVDVS